MAVQRFSEEAGTFLPLPSEGPEFGASSSSLHFFGSLWIETWRILGVQLEFSPGRGFPDIQRTGERTLLRSAEESAIRFLPMPV